jgi:type IV pilus assembly protein PilB
VLSSIHATDASSALYRLVDMGIEPFLVASSIVGVVAQRLVRRICSGCRETFTPASADVLFYEQLGGKPKDVWYHGAGCNLCSGTGYRDRVGVFEVMPMSDQIRHVVVSGGTPQQLRALAIEEGMRPLRSEAIRLVAEGITTIAEIIRTVYVV